MKLAIVLLCLVAWAVAAEEDGPPGWEEFVQHGKDQRELDKLPAVSLKDTKDGKAQVEIANETGADLVYSGYAKASPQLFFKEKKDGRWVPAGWHWCGTGMSEHTLKDGERVVFELAAEEAKAMQFFTVFRKAGEPNAFSLLKLHEQQGE